MDLDLQESDWLRVDWRATEGKVGDWEHRRVHGLIVGNRMPLVQCEQCGEGIHHGGRVTNFTPAIPTASLVELLSSPPGPRRPLSVREFLDLRSVIAGESVFSQQLYPLDLLLPVTWNVSARPKNHFYFPYPAHRVVSQEVRSIWEAEAFIGAEFYRLHSKATQQVMPYYVFMITHLVQIPEQSSGCEYCERLLGCDYPEKEIESLSKMPDIFWYYDDTLIHRRLNSVLKNAGVTEDLVVDRWRNLSKDQDKRTDGRWVLLSGSIVN